MSGGSVYDFLHKQKGVFKLPTLLKVAIDVSKGMNYLHQNNIIHRDLKAANILMDENEVCCCRADMIFLSCWIFCAWAQMNLLYWLLVQLTEVKPLNLVTQAESS